MIPRYDSITASATTSPAPVQHEFRDFVRALEQRMIETPGSVIGDSDLCPLTHRFADQTYIREIFIPAGTLIVGKIHRHSHLNFISKGRVLVRTESGGVEELVAPLTIISPAGTKRIAYALEDTTWTTVHVTDKTDMVEIEKEIIVEDYAALEAPAATPTIGGGE